MGNKSVNIIKKIRYGVIICLILFICIFLILNRDEINVDNFKRIMAQFDFAFSTSASDSDKIDFNAQSTNKYSIYKDGFVSLTEEGLKIYDKTNNMLFNYKKNFSSPVLLTSKKYCLAYDFGSSEIFLTNSFANVFEKNLHGNISFAALNDNGYFAVITKESGYKSVMRVYNKNLEEQITVSLSEKYIVYADISDNSDAIAYITLSTSTGEPVYEANLLKLNKEEPLFTVSLPESIVGINFVSNNINVIGRNNMFLLNSDDGSIQKQYNYEGRTLKSFNKASKFTVLNFESVDKLEKYQIDLIDGNMQKLSHIATDREIYDIAVSNDKFAVLLKDNVDIYNAVNGSLYKTLTFDQSYKEILLNNQEDIFLIGNEEMVRKNLDEIGG